MCIEYVMAFVILFVIAIFAIVLSVKIFKLEDENFELQMSFIDQEVTIREQWWKIEELEQELAKKNSLISILRNEIAEKENV